MRRLVPLDDFVAQREARHGDRRRAVEFWIGSHPETRLSSLFHSQTNHYLHDYPRHHYARFRALEFHAGIALPGEPSLDERFADLLEPVDDIRSIVVLGAGDGALPQAVAMSAPRASVLGIDASASNGNSLAISRSLCSNLLILRQATMEVEAILSGRADVLIIGPSALSELAPTGVARWERYVRPGGCVLVPCPDAPTRAELDSLFDGYRAFHSVERSGFSAWYKPESVPQNASQVR